MLEPKSIVIDGMAFQFQPLPAMRALRLDKRVVTLIVPVIGSMKEFSLDAEIPLDQVAQGISTALQGLSDSDFETLVADLLSTVVHQPSGEPPIQLEPQSINKYFQGKLMTLYKVAFEVMRYNKFSPFALLEGGAAMRQIISSLGPKKKGSKSGNESETSGSLLEG